MPGTVPHRPTLLGVEQAGLLSAGRGPHPDHRLGRHDVAGRCTIAGQVGDGNLKGDAVDVQGLGAVDADGGCRRDQVRHLERPESSQVEDAAEVDVEALGPLPGKDLAATDQGVHRLGSEARVVGRTARSDVDRRNGELRSEPLRATLRGDPGDRVVLRPVPRLVGDRGDRPGVVEEGLLVADLCLEPELIRDVTLGRAAVRDTDLIEHVVAELVEVRSTVWLLQGDEVGDQRDGVRAVRADEGVDVGVVGDRVLGDLRRLAVG